MKFLRYTGLIVGMLCIITGAIWPNSTHAAQPPFNIRQASVIVQCGNKQGSGVVVNGTDGYVLTNAHVLLNEQTNLPDTCIIGFVSDETYLPNIFYKAGGIQYVYDAPNNRDFAILKIGHRIRGAPLAPFPFVMTDEFSSVNDALTLITYPREATGTQMLTQGTIELFDQGTIRTDAIIGHGSSGGPAVNAEDHLIGLARGIVYDANASNELTDKPVGYELVDIRDILTWLETLGPNAEDLYITHADPTRYHAPQAFAAPTNLNCQMLAKTQLSSTVYCIKPENTRSVFPNDATYISWLSDFSSITTLSTQEISSYQLTNNVTMKTGALVKIQTDPRVYIVADAIGTLRWIPSEARAAELFGEGWAGFVKDIPVEFFSNYHIGEPLPLQ